MSGERIVLIDRGDGDLYGSMTRNVLLTEMVGWRRVGRWVEHNGGAMSRAIMALEPVPFLTRIAMVVRWQSVATEGHGGLSRSARVILAELLALAAEDDANACLPLEAPINAE